MLSLHHTHLFASDVDRSIAFWRDHFGAVVLVDTKFAGADTVHHLGIETDELDALVARLEVAGVSSPAGS